MPPSALDADENGFGIDVPVLIAGLDATSKAANLPAARPIAPAIPIPSNGSRTLIPDTIQQGVVFEQGSHGRNRP
jgi:hypothetical protein